MDIENRIKIAVLTKYYGRLLTEKQQQVIKMYVDLNLSLSEVSAMLKISRQAVKDSLDAAIASLQTYENNLQFIARDDKIKQLLTKLKVEKISQPDLLKLMSILEDN